MLSKTPKLRIKIAIAALFFCLCAIYPAHPSKAQSQITLELNKPVERQIKGGKTHSYPLTLEAGEFARVEVEKKGLDVIAILDHEAGNRLLTEDYTDEQALVIHVVAENATTYRIGVVTAAEDAPAGAYRIRLVEKRRATQRDKDDCEARRLFQAAMVLHDRPEVESRRLGVDNCLKAAGIFRSIGEHWREGVALNLAGLGYHSTGDLQLAQNVYQQAVTVFRVAGHRSGEANSLINLANVFQWMGEYQLALDCYQRTAQFVRETGSGFILRDYLYNIGNVYSLLGELHLGREFFNQTLAVTRNLPNDDTNRQRECLTFRKLGAIAASEGKYQTALAYYDQALQKNLPDNVRQTSGGILNSMGVAYRKLEEYQKSAEYHLQALRIFRELNNRLVEVETLNYLGEAYALAGKSEDARASYSQSLALSESLDNDRGKPSAQIGLARIDRSHGNLSAALQRIEQALAIIEGQRTKVVIPDQRATYFATQSEAYNLFIDLLMLLREQKGLEEYVEAAFQASECARARALLSLISESSQQLLQSANPQLAAQERQLQQQIEAKLNERTRLLSGKPTEDQKTKLTQQLSLLYAEHDQLKARVRQSVPNYAALTAPSPLTLAEVQQQALDSDTLLLEYSLGTERSYLFAVTTTEVKTFVLPKRAEIEQSVRQLHQLLTARSRQPKFEMKREWQQRITKSDREFQTVAASLSHMLLGPAREMLGKKRLLIAADGVLHYLPFAALHAPATERQPLMINHEIVNVPSASLLALQRRQLAGRKPAPKMLAVLADPVFEKDDQRVAARNAGATAKQKNSAAVDQLAQAAPRDFQRTRGVVEEAFSDLDSVEDGTSSAHIERLPFTRREAMAILSVASGTESKVALGFDANRTLATSAELGQYRYLHFATHGLLNTKTPNLSGLALSLVGPDGKEQNGFLRTMDIYNLRLSAELVVLSGCSTGLGKQVQGEGLIGLTRGFMYAGATRVMVSLWNVNDQATAELMSHFYREMLTKKQSPAAALRAAQTAMSRDPRFSSPYYWAGFILQGEPR
ncbi:MAG: CHAT domain-containing protein [Blastocatellia bacterium]